MSKRSEGVENEGLYTHRSAVTTSDRLGKMTKRPRTNSPYASREMHEWLFGTALRGITSLDQRAAATGAT